VNDVFKNIYLRRAVRDYKPHEVPDDIIKELIKAGTYAPSARNKQPWRFVVVKDKGVIARLSERAKKLSLDGIGKSKDPEAESLATALKMPGFNVFYNAPLLILIFASPDAMSPERECSLAAENMMLAGRSLGIGSCFIGLALPLGSDDATLEELRVPKGHSLIAPLIFGYPVKDIQTAPPRKEDVILNWIPQRNAGQ
jgi:nitroreductase